MARRIQRGDEVKIDPFLYGDGEPIVGGGTWLAAEDDGVDADGVRRVLLERPKSTERVRWLVSELKVTRPVEAKVADLLMGGV